MEKKQFSHCGQWREVVDEKFVEHIRQLPKSADQDGVVKHEHCPGSGQSIHETAKS